MRGAVGAYSERMWQQAGEEAPRGSSTVADEPRGPLRDQTGGEAPQGPSAVADEPCRPFSAARVRYVVTTAAVVGSAYLEMIDAAAELRAQLM